MLSGQLFFVLNSVFAWTHTEPPEHHFGSQIEDAVVRAVIQHTDGIKLQVDIVGLDLTALIDTRQVAE